jgi:hypothetical protein
VQAPASYHTHCVQVLVVEVFENNSDLSEKLQQNPSVLDFFRH